MKLALSRLPRPVAVACQLPARVSVSSIIHIMQYWIVFRGCVRIGCVKARVGWLLDVATGGLSGSVQAESA